MPLEALIFTEVDAELTGTFEINMNNGTYSGNNLLLEVDDPINEKYYVRRATLNGAFHNRGATGVSGIFYDNVERNYGGIFTGARTDIRSRGS